VSETRTYVPSPLFSERARPRAAAERPELDGVGYLITAAVAVGIFLVALDHATYAETSRTTLAVGVWWAVLLVVALGPRRVISLPWPAFATGGLLLTFAAWTFASTQWAASAERAFVEGDRVLLFAGLFALVVLLSPRGSAGCWADGLALGITSIGLLALTSRLFPELISTNDFETVLTSAYSRLSYPLGYWNGLAIFTAIGFPLLLRAALDSRQPLLRGLALTPLPALAAVLYLTSSRGGFAVALFGTLCFLLLTPRRWHAVAATVLAGVACAGAVAVLEARTELVNNPNLAVAKGQGHSAALLIAAICVLTGVIWAAANLVLLPRLPQSRRLERAAAGFVVVVAAAGLVAAQPVDRFDRFKALPGAQTGTDENFVSNHLTSTSGSGRWQLWTAAVDEYRTEPLHGRGAGSYEAWWLQSPIFAGFARDAHSLYAETLGELGIVGLCLLAATLLAGALTGLRRVLEGRPAAAGLLAAFLGYALGAAIDWVWELTAVTLVAVVLLAALTGPALLAARRFDGRARPSRGAALALAAVLGLLALTSVGAEGLGLATQVRIDDSQNAIARGDVGEALDAAVGAGDLEPWAASPYLQEALVEEQAGELRAAQRAIAKAIERDPNDWTLWLTQSRIQIKLGEGRAGLASCIHSKELYPRSFLQCG
jgi:tetratricopeptide (TPR) repeat protein